MARSLTTSPPLSDSPLISVIQKLQIFATDLLLNVAGLAIGTNKKKILIANTVYAWMNGTFVIKTTAELTLTTALNVANAKFNIIIVSMDSAGTVTLTPGTEAATLAAVVLGTMPSTNVMLGFVIINPTGTGGFVGGTTDLDDATVVPNAVYVDTSGTSIKMGMLAL